MHLIEAHLTVAVWYCETQRMLCNMNFNIPLSLRYSTLGWITEEVREEALYVENRKMWVYLKSNQRRNGHQKSSTWQPRLLITVLKRYCFWGQIHSIPGYWSIPQYSWSNLFQFSSCRGSKIVTVFSMKTVLFITVFTGITVLRIPVNRAVFLSIPEYYCLRM